MAECKVLALDGCVCLDFIKSCLQGPIQYPTQLATAANRCQHPFLVTTLLASARLNLTPVFAWRRWEVEHLLPGSQRLPKALEPLRSDLSR